MFLPEKNPEEVRSVTPGGAGIFLLVFLHHCSGIPDKNMLDFFHLSCFFPLWKGRVSQTSLRLADGSISIQRNPRHQQLRHKEKGNQGKRVGMAFPEGSVCP